VQAGLVEAGLVAIDGTKVAADASFFANRSRRQLAAEILAEAEEVDAGEEEVFGDRRGEELPEQWAGGRERRSRIRAALEELDRGYDRDHASRMAERAAREAATGRKLPGPQPRTDPPGVQPRRVNTTDPHCRVVPRGAHAVVQGYNAQAAATAGQIVVAAEVTATSNDQPHFVPMATAHRATWSRPGTPSGSRCSLPTPGTGLPPPPTPTSARTC
jgi:hypothetical protein